MLPKPPLLIAAGLTLTLLSGAAAALGLGTMRTQSALNQPFYAEIELSNVGVDEIDAVKARLASREEFTKAGAERPHFLTRLQFASAIGTDGRPYIQVSSREPIREPYIDFLVEVIWPQGRLVKEYTVLLDPPARGRSAPPRVVPPRTAAPVRRPPPEAPPPLRDSARQEPPTQQAAAPPPRQPVSPVPPAARGTRFPLYYGPVERGATLTRIAREMTPPGATVEQTAMAIFRNNQDAFMRADINRLRIGVDLIVPTAEELFALDQTAARREFENALAGRSVNTSPITDVAADARLRIAGGADSATPGPAAPALPGVPSAPVDGGLRDDLLFVQETTESNRLENTELRNRIIELESQLAQIQRLLQSRNAEIAQLQGTTAVGGDEMTPGTGPLPAPPPPGEGLPLVPEPTDGMPLVGDPEQSDRPPVAPIVDPNIGSVQSDGTVEVLPPAEPVLEPTPPEQPVAEAAAPAAPGEPAPPVTDDQVVSAPEATTAEVPPQPAEPSEPAEPGAAEETGRPFWAGPVDAVVGTLGSLPVWALGTGTAVVLLGVAGLLAYRRRRQEPAEMDLDLDFDELPPAETQAGAATDKDAAAEFASSAYQVDSTSAGTIDAETMPKPADSTIPATRLTADSGGRSEIDGHTGLPVNVVSNMPQGQQQMEEADVVAEADIYILYGRYREAENLLREELAVTPNRPELRFKLGEALVGSGNAAALAELMDEMRAAGDANRDVAKWATLENGLASLNPPIDSGEGLGQQTQGAIPTQASPIRALDNVTTDIGSPSGIDDDLADGTDLAGDSEDTGLGFSVREVSPSSAERLREQMEDLELDLQDMDALSGSLDSTGPADTSEFPSQVDETIQGDAAQVSGSGGEAAAAEIPLELPEPLSPKSDDRLDLDLEELDQLASEPDVIEARGPAEEPPSLNSDLDDLSFSEPSAPRDGLDEAMQGAADLDEMLQALEPAQTARTEAPLASGSPALEDPALDVPDAAQEGSGAPTDDSISSDMLSSQWRMDSERWDEAGTKMDLARAYVEMEDPEAARTILEEVIQEGSDEQRAEAQQLLANLG